MSGILDVSRALKDPGQSYPFSATLELEEMEVLSDPVRFEAIRAEGEFLCPGDERISLKASATARVHTRCDRCLEPVQLDIAAEVDALYVRQPDPDDPDLYVYDSSRVDLTDAVRDALILALPLQFLCSSDCRGLCPRCGANLNKGACTCLEGDRTSPSEFASDSEDRVTNPFAALNSFMRNNEEV